jgi:hypothetical protein
MKAFGCPGALSSGGGDAATGRGRFAILDQNGLLPVVFALGYFMHPGHLKTA